MRLSGPALLIAAMTASAACGRSPALDTRTFDLHYLDPGSAEAMISPYVFTDRPGAAGKLSTSEHTLTVRETPDNLEKIARVLAEHDTPQPWVRLHFQIIEADGGGPADPRIAGVETELKKLFRFSGYRLLGEAVVSGTARSAIQQSVSGEGGPYYIDVDIRSVRAVGDTGLVTMAVNLRGVGPRGLSTMINARENQTVVLGSAQLTSRQGTTILTVRPELVRQ
jgi:hypothetical protein